MRKHSEYKVYEFGDFRLDAGSLMLYQNGSEVSLVPKAAETLLVLIESQGKIITKNELIEAVWPDAVVEESNLALYLHILRKTLGNRKDGKPYVETYRRRGYRFNGDARLLQAAENGFSDTSGEDLFNRNTSENGVKRKKQRYVFALSVGAILLAAIFAASFYWRSGQASANADAPRTIAILPFKPLVAEDRDEFLEIGMADALISRLAERREIEVRPLNSARALVNTGKESVAIGQALGVDAVLEGGVRRSGNRVHTNLRLVRIADGRSLWTEAFEGNYQDLLGERGLIERLTAAVALRLAGSDRTARSHRTENVEAWEYHVKGRYKVGQLTPPRLEESIDYFGKAAAVDSNYALAYAGLSWAYTTLAPASDYPPTEVFPKAKTAALKALEIDNELSEGHSALAWIMFWNEWDWAGAESRCKRAIELNPNSADAHRSYAHLLSNVGRHSEALAEIKRARELDAINPLNEALEGQFLLYAGQPDKALDKLRKTVDVLPEFWLAHLFISSIYIEKGMYEEAISEADLAGRYSGATNHPAAFKGYALAKSGKQAEARRVLDDLSRQAKETFVNPSYFALIYNGLGDTDKAISWLERGIEQRDCKMVFLKVEPKWNNLRSDPRFAGILSRMNFPP